MDSHFSRGSILYRSIQMHPNVNYLKRTHWVYVLLLAEQRKLAEFILAASDSFTDRFQHTQQIITNTHVCMINSSIFYHSKSLT